MKQVAKDGDVLPKWPQPVGIFTGGTQFDPIAFLKKILEMYDQLIIQKNVGSDLLMEYEAFALLLTDRVTVLSSGRYIFKLYDLIMPTDLPDGLIVDYSGKPHLRIDCLGNDLSDTAHS